MAIKNKSKIIEESLRKDIVNGKFLSGQKSPTFQQMEKKHLASRGALQLAVEQLKKPGFVTSLDRRGIFVSENPPSFKKIFFSF